jgi:hypothetical protein
MNTLNYATLEAAQRLVDARIVLETDLYYARDEAGWYFRDEENYHREVLESIPAPSMAEVWRALPDDTQISKYHQSTCLYTGCWTDDSPVFSEEHLHSTDALIKLLIWVKAQKEGV